MYQKTKEKEKLSDYNFKKDKLSNTGGCDAYEIAVFGTKLGKLTVGVKFTIQKQHNFNK